MNRMTISEHNSDAGSWRIARLDPERSLAPYIEAFYAYDERGTSFRRRRELPDGSAVLIFHLAGALRVEHPPGAGHEFSEGQGFYSGASGTYVGDGNRRGANRRANQVQPPWGETFSGPSAGGIWRRAHRPLASVWPARDGAWRSARGDALAEQKSRNARASRNEEDRLPRPGFARRSPSRSGAFTAPTFASRTSLARSE